MSEVRLSDIDLGDRMDTDYFAKSNMQIEQTLRKVHSQELRIFANFVASAFYPAATQLYSIGDTPFIRCVDCINYPLITKRQDDTFEKIPMSFVLENDGINLLNKNDIVITKVGSPCYASLVYEHNEVALSRTVMGLKNIKCINPFYLLVFLRSKYGFTQLLRVRELTIQYQLTLERVKRIRIFVPEESFQLQIEQMVKSAHAKLEESKQLYAAVEDQLLLEIGLKDWQPKNQNINVKNLSESFLRSGRLDAEYYQSKYDEIEAKIKSYNGGYDFISNRFVQNNDVCNYEKAEYKYIEIGDVNVGDGSVSPNIIPTIELPDNAKRVLHFNDILISKVRPYRGAVAIINFDDNDLIGSGAFTVLRENGTYKKEVLQVLLRTDVYKDWLLKWNVGSSYPVIKDEDVLNLPIPIIPAKIQEEISSKIQKSFALKAESKRLLEQAKLMVEQEIEKGGE
ncbi:MAG: restriction endonuclease subunit S [Bacteroidales bacterium]|nr:restriction endonuclease subunit S [Bacteroidales bacterium]